MDDDDDINPKTVLPKPYINTQDKPIIPPLNLISDSDRPIVCRESSLEITPVTHCINSATSRDSKSKSSQSRRKPKPRVECVNTYSISPAKSLHWSAQDHLRGRKIERTHAENVKSTHSKIRRRPAFFNNVCKTKSVTKSDSTDTKNEKLPVPITAIEAGKFRKPEYNSTLKLAEEIKRLQIVKKSVNAEIAEQLKTERMTQEVSEKAAVQVNVPFYEQQFKSLVPVDVSIIEAAIKLQEEKESRMKAVKPQPRVRDPEPNVMNFFTDSIYHECCDIHLEIPRLELNTPESASDDWAFRHFQRLQERNEPI